jgi:hypothetical protein
MVCPVCGERLAANQVETHLRQRHQIFQFRGERRSPSDTLTHLLSLICKSPPDREAWNTLYAIVREQHGSGADRFLAASLAAVLARVPPERRESTISTIASSMFGGDITSLVGALAGDADPLAQQFALSLALRWPGPIPAALIPAYAPLLSDPKQTAATQVAVAVAFLRSLPTEKDPREQTLLEALISGMSRVPAVQRLYAVEEQVGRRPLIKAVRERIENQIRMRCPRCDLELRRAEMIDHLWSEHRLVLEGQKVREPWTLIQDWLDDTDGVLPADVLSRCQSLAQQVDPDNGLVRLYRMVLQVGLKDPESQKGLLGAAKERRASICPSCFTLLPVPHPVPGRPLNRWRGRLSGKGYRVEVLETGLKSRLELKSPRDKLIRVTEPGNRWTVRGWLWLTVGPLLLIAIGLALGPPPLGDPLPWVVIALLTAAVVGGIVAAKKKPKVPVTDRVVDHAWSMMLPRLAERGFIPSDAHFLAGLALVSLDRGRLEARKPLLEKALRFAASEVLQGREVGPLAALKRLGVSDAVQEGRDPIPLVLEEIDFCLKGKLPLAYGEALLTDWETDWWTAGNLARLKVMVCDRAFEAGYEVSDLVEIGQTYAALGSVLDVAQPRRLLLLRLLWSMRATRPWDRASDAITVFEFCQRRESPGLLNLFPDLLLLHENASYMVAHAARKDTPTPLRIVTCGRGVALQGVLFEKKPTSIEVSGKRSGGHYEMRAGSETFRFSAEASFVAERLERWFRFLLNDFLPQVGQVINWKSPDVGAKLRARGAMPCPECKRPLLPRVGAVARSIVE